MARPDPLPLAEPLLLAKKGAARPAMRPQLQLYDFGKEAGGEAMASGFDPDDLGWNDLGEESDPSEPVRISFSLTPLAADSADAAGPDEEVEDEQSWQAAQAEFRASFDNFEAGAIADEDRHDASAFAFPPEPGPQFFGPVATERESVPLVEAEPENSREVEAASIAEQTSRIAGTGFGAVLSRCWLALLAGFGAGTALRIDRARHLRLRMLSVRKGRSRQSLVNEALDQFFERNPKQEYAVQQKGVRRIFGVLPDESSEKTQGKRR